MFKKIIFSLVTFSGFSTYGMENSEQALFQQLINQPIITSQELGQQELKKIVLSNSKQPNDQKTTRQPDSKLFKFHPDRSQQSKL